MYKYVYLDIYIYMHISRFVRHTSYVVRIYSIHSSHRDARLIDLD